MGSIVLKLNPEKLINPDVDIRYLIPSKIEELTLGKVTDNGYDYIEDEVSSMVIFLKSANPKEDIIDVCNILRTNNFKDNNIFEVSEIYLTEKNDDELDACNYNLAVYERFIK